MKLLLLLFLVVPFVSGASSENFQTNLITDSGGQVTTSENYENNLVAGTIAGETSSSDYITQLGFFYGLGFPSFTEIPFIIWIVLLSWLIYFTGLWRKEIWITYVGLCVVLISGIEIFVNGVGDINNYLTRTVGFIHFGVSLIGFATVYLEDFRRKENE